MCLERLNVVVGVARFGSVFLVLVFGARGILIIVVVTQK